MNSRFWVMMLLSGGNFASSSVEMILLSIHQWLLLKVALHLWYHANETEEKVKFVIRDDGPLQNIPNVYDLVMLRSFDVYHAMCVINTEKKIRILLGKLVDAVLKNRVYKRNLVNLKYFL